MFCVESELKIHQAGGTSSALQKQGTPWLLLLSAADSEKTDKKWFDRGSAALLFNHTPSQSHSFICPFV